MDQPEALAIPQFLILPGSIGGKDNQMVLANLGLVRTIEVVEGGCLLRFSEAHSIVVNGAAAAELLSLVVENAYLTNGESAREFADHLKSKLLSTEAPKTKTAGG